jgi:cytoskeletal protein CcmA (bactofilin family)
VLGASASLEGKFTSSSNIRIDGNFTGTLEINGNVLVGETARINADIHAKNISIAGAVRGNVFGKKVQLLRTGRVWGDISATALTTEEGAFIDGKISMVSHDAANVGSGGSSPLTSPVADADVMPIPPVMETEALPPMPGENADELPLAPQDAGEPDFLDRDGDSV